MKPLHRILILASLALLSAAALPAQHFISGGGSSGFSGFGGGFNGGYGYAYGSPYAGWGLGGGFYDSFGGWGGDVFGGLHHPEEHAPFGVVMAHGDADFQPSQYMDYDKAVALGKKILEEEAAPKPSLGDIARSLRASRHVTQTQVKPELLATKQDNHGKLPVCQSGSDKCRSTT